MPTTAARAPNEDRRDWFASRSPGERLSIVTAIVIGIGSLVVFTVLQVSPDGRKSRTVSAQPPVATSPARKQRATPTGEPIYVMKSGYFTASSEEKFDRAARIAQDGDEAALGRLHAAGEIALTYDGVQVVIDESRAFSSRVRLRPIGKTHTFWTLKGAIDPVYEE